MLALYADECVDARIVDGLRRRGVDVATAADATLLGGSDEQHVSRACEQNRVILTCDHDFLTLAHTLLAKGSEFPGLIFIQPETRVGEAVRVIALTAAVFEPVDMRNWIEWGP